MVVRDPFMLGSSTHCSGFEGADTFPCSWYGCQVWMLKDGTSKNKDQDCSSGCIPEVVFDL